MPAISVLPPPDSHNTNHHLTSGQHKWGSSLHLANTFLHWIFSMIRWLITLTDTNVPQREYDSSSHPQRRSRWILSVPSHHREDEIAKRSWTIRQVPEDGDKQLRQSVGSYDGIAIEGDEHRSGAWEEECEWASQRRNATALRGPETQTALTGKSRNAGQKKDSIRSGERERGEGIFDGKEWRLFDLYPAKNEQNFSEIYDWLSIEIIDLYSEKKSDEPYFQKIHFYFTWNKS